MISEGHENTATIHKAQNNCSIMDDNIFGKLV